MKTYMSAEQFEKEAAKIQERCDKFAARLGAFLMRKTQALYDQLDDDQRERVKMRLRAKANEQKRKIIMPGNHITH